MPHPRINPASYDTYLKAYSMAMLPNERENLNYGGKSTSSSSVDRGRDEVLNEHSSLDASVCTSRAHATRPAVSMDVQASQPQQRRCFDARRCAGVRRAGRLRTPPLLDDEDTPAQRGRSYPHHRCRAPKGQVRQAPGPVRALPRAVRSQGDVRTVPNRARSFRPDGFHTGSKSRYATSRR
jgi:hypothetical protein